MSARILHPYHVRLAISQFGDQFRAELFTEDLGDTVGDLLPARWDVLDEWLPYLALGASSLPPDGARKLGQKLFEFLLGMAENSKKWTEVLEQARRQGRPVRLLIDATTDQVRDLPFGLMCEPHDNYYLMRPSPGRNPIRCVRIVRRCTPRLLRWSNPARILLAAAEPASPDVTSFDCSRWLCELASGLAPLYELFVCTPTGPQPVGTVAPGPREEWQPAQFAQFCRTTPESLRLALERGHFDILHLLGHGLASGVVLCNAAGKKAEVTAGDLASWCAAENDAGETKLQAAFLQVCRGAETGERGSFGGTAQQLLNPRGGNLAAVVASPYPLDAEHSTRAALGFYQHLATGATPDTALERGLEEVNWSWAFLELWARPGALSDTGTRGDFQFVSPYRGLALFREEDAEIFFGRDAEVAELTQLLRHERLLAVAGDSGSGKSSLLQAGLIHHVRTQGLADLTGWRIVTIRPGSEPMRRLLSGLRPQQQEEQRPAPPTTESFRQQFQEAVSGAGSSRPPLLLVVDQFEEIFTLCKDAAQRDAVAEMLVWLAQNAADKCRIVLGMRVDYIGQAVSLPGLGDLLTRPWVLRPPGAREVRDIVSRPAEIFGYRFEGPGSDGDAAHGQGLLARILSDPLLSGQPRAGGTGLTRTSTPLPLVEFALERLWLRAVAHGSHQFTHTDYDELGGLAGAIAQYAEDVFLALAVKFGPDSSGVAETLIKGVVSSHETRRPRFRRDLEAEVDPVNQPLARIILDHLVGERLLTIRSSTDKPGEAVVDLSHEVLLAYWGRLKEWLAQDPEGRALKEAFQQDVEKWDRGVAKSGPRSRKNLPAANEATTYLGWILKARPTLTQTQQAFADELRSLQTRRRWARARHLIEVGLSSCQSDRIGEGLHHLFDAQKLLLPLAEPALRRGVLSLLGVWGKANGFPLPHKDVVRAVTFSPSGEHVLTGSRDKTAVVWDVASGKPLQTLLHAGGVTAVAFSPAGHRLLTGSEDNTAVLWDAVSGQPLQTYRHTAGVSGVAFSPAGERVLTGSADKTAVLWDVASGQLLQTFRHTNPVRAVAFGPASDCILTASRDSAMLWEVSSSNAVQALPHKDRVRAVAFSPTGDRLLTGSEDNTAVLWDAASGQPLQTFRHTDGVWAVAFSPSGDRVLTGSEDMTVVLWDAGSGRLLRTIRHTNAVWAATFNSTGDRLLTACGDRAVLWDAARECPLQTLPHTDGVSAVAFNATGDRLLTACGNKTAVVWDTVTGRALQTVRHSDWVWAIAFDPSGDRLLTGSGDRTAVLWDAGSGQALHVFRHADGVWGVAFNPTGDRVLTGGADKTAVLWDVASGNPLQTYRHSDGVRAVAFSLSGDRVLTGSADKTAIVWDTASGRVLQTFQHTDWVRSVAFSPTGDRVLTGSADKTAVLWDIASGQPLETFRHTDWVTDVAFSPLGDRVLTASRDKTAVLWDVASGKPLQTYRHTDRVWAVAFSPTGDCLLTGSRDQTAVLWMAPPTLAEDIDLRRLQCWIEVITNLRRERSGALVPLSSEALAKRKKRLDALGGPPVTFGT